MKTKVFEAVIVQTPKNANTASSITSEPAVFGIKAFAAPDIETAKTLAIARNADLFKDLTKETEITVRPFA